MWYPSKLQWFVIWMTTVICLLIWLGSADPRPAEFILPGTLIGFLFVWQVSQDFTKRRDDE